MKKFIALLLALVMVLSMVACGEKAPEQTQAPAQQGGENKPAEGENKPAEGEKPAGVEVVTYYCTIGAYLHILEEEVAKWNAGEGKEKGVEIQITSEINSGSEAIELQFQAGNYWDLMDGGSNPVWVAQGWVKDLETIDNEQLKKLIEETREYMVPGLSYVGGITTSLPLEVLPIKMAVNLDLFKASGLDPYALKTWDDVVAAAKKITEDNPGTAWGYGGTNWSAYYRRLHMKAVMNSTEKGWWDPNTETYSFGQYETVMKALRQMYVDGSILGLDDLAIDPIRAEFAAGKVGMFPAPAYDWSVYTNQFPAVCEFTFVDMPSYDGTAPYKGVMINRVNNSICAPLYDASTPEHQAAVVEAFNFLNSDYLNGVIYANAGMIPVKKSIIDSTELVITENVEAWKAMAQIDGYAPMFVYPDSAIQLEGDNYGTVFSAFVHGDIEWSDEMIADLEARYNAAYQAAKADPDVDTGNYAYSYAH
jgi:multiple sugar transport system substrate-binding protein